MSHDNKQPDAPVPAAPITLVARERGFAMGRMVEPGTTFLFNPVGADGKPRKLPKWAVPAGTALAPKKPVVADLKPPDAQAAVRKKAGQLSGSDLV